MNTKLGYNLYEGGERDKISFSDHIRRTQAPVLVIDSETRALELAEISPFVISRHPHIDYRRDEGIDVIYWFTPAEYVDTLLKKSPSRKTVKCVLNEPIPRSRDELVFLCNWLAEVGALLAEMGYRAVLGNFSVATEHWEDVKAGVFDHLIRAIHKYRNLLSYGAHNYTWGALPLGWGVWTWRNVDPRTAPDNPIANPNNWFGKEHIILKNTWHMGRHQWVTNIRAEQIVGESIPVDITEIGWAKVADISDQDPTFYPYMDSLYPASNNAEHGLNGPESLAHLWKDWWGGWSQAQAMHNQLEHTLRMYEPNNRYAFYFSMGTFTEYGQNSIGNEEFLRLRESMGVPIKDEPKPDTIPVRQYPSFHADDERWYSVALKAKSKKKANVRHLPTTVSPAISEIPHNTPREVFWLDEPYVDGAGHTWMPTKIVMQRHPEELGEVVICGWVRTDVVQVIE